MGERAPSSLTHVAGLRIELGPAAGSVERAGRRLADLLRSVPDPAAPVRGLSWTLGEMAAHVAARTELFAAYLDGTRVPRGAIADIASENRRGIDARSGRTLAENVEDLSSNVTAFVGTTRGKLGADPVPWYSGLTLDVATVTGLLLAELLVHGFDIARTLGRRWAIDPDEARTIIRASAAVAPHYVDRAATRGTRTTYRIAVRKGPSFRIRIDRGTATVEPPNGDADCTIHADPVTLVLVSFGRVGRFRPIATGKLLATGRRPWRALSFQRSFLPP